MESTLEEGIFYHLAIIDYLQKYTAKRVAEKNYKRIK